MHILYIGDVMGSSGIEVVETVLPELKKKRTIDFVIAQSENVTEGRGMSADDMHRLQAAGIEFFTGGNWSLFRDGVLNDKDPVIRPANYPPNTKGSGFKYAPTKFGNVLIISLLGKIVGKDADKPIHNPLQAIDEILDATKSTSKVATVINFHGDYSSEKKIIGYYLDGKVSAVIGDHWHIPTADAMILPHGTAHITDVGMCGSLHSSLGVELDSVIPRWKNGRITKNVLATHKPYQFNAVLIEINTTTGLARSIEHIQKTISE